MRRERVHNESLSSRWCKYPTLLFIIPKGKQLEHILDSIPTNHHINYTYFLQQKQDESRRKILQKKSSAIHFDIVKGHKYCSIPYVTSDELNENREKKNSQRTWKVNKTIKYDLSVSAINLSQSKQHFEFFTFMILFGCSFINLAVFDSLFCYTFIVWDMTFCGNSNLTYIFYLESVLSRDSIQN